MRYRALIGLVLLAMLGTTLAGCADSAGTDAMLKFSEDLTLDQSLSDVQTAMPDSLAERMTIYPAREIRKTDNGNWIVSSKEGGTAGDTDAPFQIMLVSPLSNNSTTLAILFEDKVLMDITWWGSRYVSILIEELTGDLLPEGTTSTTEAE